MKFQRNEMKPHWAKRNHTATMHCPTLVRANTFIRSNPWFPSWSNIKSFLQHDAHIHDVPNTIADLSIPDSKLWDIPKIAHIFGHQVAAEI
jgi:hypothetical protein